MPSENVRKALALSGGIEMEHWLEMGKKKHFQ